MRTDVVLGTLLFVLGVLLGIIQLWFAPFNPEIFLKLEMTLGALLAVVLVVHFVIKEYREDKATRSGDRLDG